MLKRLSRFSIESVAKFANRCNISFGGEVEQFVCGCSEFFSVILRDCAVERGDPNLSRLTA